jgi:hypothetical protein
VLLLTSEARMNRWPKDDETDECCVHSYISVYTKALHRVLCTTVYALKSLLVLSLTLSTYGVLVDVNIQSE